MDPPAAGNLLGAMVMQAHSWRHGNVVQIVARIMRVFACMVDFEVEQE